MDKKTIFITGAAAGIGRASALKFARAGWFVGAYDLDARGLESLQAELGAERCCTGPLDVTKPEQIEAALADFTKHTGGRLHVLFNNAGVLSTGPFEEVSAARNKLQVDINVTGVIECTRQAFALLKATPGARVVSMCSASALYGVPDFAVYAATKHAVRALTEALEIEWKRHDIVVSDVMAPFVKTAMVAGTRPVPIIENLGVNLTAEDVADTVWHAATTAKPQTHWPVGKEFARTKFLAGILPASLLKLAMVRASGYGEK